MAHHRGMSVVAASRPTAAPAGVATGVLVGALTVSVSLVPLLLGLPHDRVSSGAALPLLVWPVLGVAGLVVLDRRPGRAPASAFGWACVVASVLPTIVLAGRLVAALVEQDVPVDVGGAMASLGPWALLPLLVPGVVSWVASRRGRGSRDDLRWGIWATLVGLTTVALATASWTSGALTTFGAVAAVGIGSLAVVATTSAMVERPRPVLEPLLDVGLVVVVVLAAGVGGSAVRWFALAEQIVAPDVLGGLAAAGVVAMGVPAAVWTRRRLVRHRYGPGVLQPDDVAALTSGLAADSDPRDLLARAAAMVAGASGVPEARIVLDEVEPSDGWAGNVLTVADDVVGTLLLRLPHADGLERCQTRAVSQLVPTVALAARAVALAVEADHARRDTQRLRETERRRILGDLHDDLGPTLAGMSMRVAAVRSAHDLPELDGLAEDLRVCRADLRRIVAGLTPSVLESVGLAEAVRRLVASFGTTGRPVVEVGVLLDDVPLPLASVVYRTVAEGVTNAVRHAHADRVQVDVERAGAHVLAVVTDDGHGGPVVPGTGLTSLRGRAEAVGGTLRIDAAPSGGTRLVASLPGGRA